MMNDSVELTRRSMLASTALLWLVGKLSGGESQAAASDPRREKLLDLNGYFPFAVPATREAWEARAEALKRQMLVATGLWPSPSRPPVQAVVHGKVERPGYSVEKVYFESSPGLFVTGSLYRPSAQKGAAPLVLCPHGHWQHGRFFDHGELLVREELKKGAEKFPVSGRYPLQARCVHLARMGCVVFHYDMLGYADSVPISQGVAHGFRKQRPEMSQAGRWGLFSPQAEHELWSPLGLQTFNSVRALDWALTLPGIDPKRVGVTGASGGGTQTFLLAAVDERPTAAFPAVMVSTSMQGGCTCENASYLRVETGNIEIAGLCAPRPLGMSAADDWTKELESKGLPELKRLYALLGVEDRVEGKYFPFPHNYNAVSRQMMYEFFNKHFELGFASPIVEEDFVPLTKEELSVWTSAHPMPAEGDDAEAALLRHLSDDVRAQIEKLTPTDAKTLAEFHRVVGGGWRVMIGRELPATSDVVYEADLAGDKDVSQDRGTLLLSPRGERVGVWHGKPAGDSKRVVIWATKGGIAGLFAGEEPLEAVKELLASGAHVLGLDLLYQAPGLEREKSRSLENGREAACFTIGYNHPPCAQRVHDVLTAIAYARGLVGKDGIIDLVGLGGAGLWVAAAALVARQEIASVAIGTGGFRFAPINDIEDPDLWPGAVRYGDLPALLGLVAPTPMWLAGEGGHIPSVTKACYLASGKNMLVVSSAGEQMEAKEAVRWLVSRKG